MSFQNFSSNKLKFRGHEIINTMGVEIKNKPVFKRNYKYIIGIDPGVKTGFAIWIKREKTFHCIETISIHTALNWVNQWSIDHSKEMFVIIEDARKRKWFGKQAGTHALQGAGSIKRDCKVWEDFLTDLKVDFEMVDPKNNSTKVDSKKFKQMTGWVGQTSEHARDAAMLCYGY